MIVTEAGVHPNVSALGYVAARAPDAGEDYTVMAKLFRHHRHPRASCLTAMKDVSARARSCAILQVTFRKRRRAFFMRFRSHFKNLS